MTTRNKKASPDKGAAPQFVDNRSTEQGYAPMATEQPVWGAASTAHCSQCDQLWQRTLAALQVALPPQHFETVSRTFREVWQADRGLVEAAGAAKEEQQLELVISHDCAAVACTDPNCGLCCNSTSRRCSDLLLPKYLVRDPLVPACGAPASVKIKRRSANGTRDESLAEDDFKQLPAFVLQVRCHAFVLVEGL